MYAVYVCQLYLYKTVFKIQKNCMKYKCYESGFVCFFGLSWDNCGIPSIEI